MPTIILFKNETVLYQNKLSSIKDLKDFIQQSFANLP